MLYQFVVFVVSDSILDVRFGVSSIYQQLSYQFYNINFLMLVKY